VIKRRLFIMAGAAWLANPAQPQAQRGDKVYRIGLFHVGTDHISPSLEEPIARTMIPEDTVRFYGVPERAEKELKA
jgi:hypothetical protein